MVKVSSSLSFASLKAVVRPTPRLLHSAISKPKVGVDSESCLRELESDIARSPDSDAPTLVEREGSVGVR